MYRAFLNEIGKFKSSGRLKFALHCTSFKSEESDICQQKAA
ncbi:hypothetical protein CSUNSWCD_1973 [Campylobacter showae CSUNSWCD]|uniref:Uncharacterized protein n=1 Tax=Campylobacter showae CSUNSWCD TaxID=1244083 RepID=M5IFX4_9BACT|nr:hypothetical protein CSUNSWCD_1973 [Campylobacter showae CSUNSWCD]